MHLTGNRRHTIDAKLRLKLPAEFRREFESQVCLLPLNGVLYGFTPEGHARWVEEQFSEGFNPRNRDQVEFLRLLNALTETVDIDSAGRICLGRIDERYRQGIVKGMSVRVSGNDDHFEIWPEELVDEMDDEGTEAELENLFFDE